MKYFITGATGYIGTQLCKQLSADGHSIHALYRSESKTTELKSVDGVKLFKGDLSNHDSLQRAVSGCDAVFHVAAFAKPWHKDSQFFYRLNVDGAENVFQASKKEGTKRIVFTSTAGVISPSAEKASHESTPRTQDYFTHYERSKAQAEEKALIMTREEGMEIITVNPTRVYGPGLLSDSNGVTRMIKMYLEGKFRLMPGNGKSIGNYVFIDDVVEGHIKAMQKGKPGERYIIGGDNASFNEFFAQLAEASGKKVGMFNIPIPVIHVAARLMEIRANLTGAAPLLTPPWVKKYLYNWELSTQKAEQELGYEPSSLKEGLEQTVEWITSQ